MVKNIVTIILIITEIFVIHQINRIPNEFVCENKLNQCTEYSIDTSCVKNGYVAVWNDSSQKLRFMIEPDNTESYALNKGINYFPITVKSKTHRFSIWRNLKNTKYMRILETETNVKPDYEKTFLFSSNIVNYNNHNRTKQVSNIIMLFSSNKKDFVKNTIKYIYSGIEYDKERPDIKGYLSNPDETLKTKKGICVDNAVLFASIMRYQNIPAKVVYGYYKNEYHAWNEIKINNKWYMVDTIFEENIFCDNNLYKKEKIY